MRKHLLVLFLLMFAGFSATLDYDLLATSPSPLDGQGYVHITFCSKEVEFIKFRFSATDFTVSPSSIDVDFSGTALIPDCKQIPVFVKSDRPGQYVLTVAGDSDEWTVPVDFEKNLPISISTSEAIIYTGYSDVSLRVTGQGEDVWITVNQDVVGLNTMYKPSMPANFPFTFYFEEAGFQVVPVNVSYIYGDATLSQIYKLGLRVEEAPVQVGGELSVPSGSYSDLSLDITSPEKMYGVKISISSTCLEGETEKYLADFQSGTLDFKVRSTCDPGIYELTVSIGDYMRKVPLTVTGPEGYELFFNPEIMDGESSLEIVIANKGSNDMRAVSIRLLDGDYTKIKGGSFLGDLEGGDYDSAELEFIPKKNPVTVNFVISYNQDGQRQNITKSLTYSKVKTKVSSTTIILLAGVAFFGYRKFRNRRSGN
ncbi:MAG: hypothetical protein GOV00_02260 [Candidatus Altiarchaeota archaeon]|nr:hypothetical protein [Candidatus Altiarchaeota archaeon]